MWQWIQNIGTGIAYILGSVKLYEYWQKWTEPRPKFSLGSVYAQNTGAQKWPLSIPIHNKGKAFATNVRCSWVTYIDAYGMTLDGSSRQTDLVGNIDKGTVKVFETTISRFDPTDPLTISVKITCEEEATHAESVVIQVQDG